MINRSLEISEADREKLSAVAEYQGTNFATLVALAGLDKTKDFRGADLSQVDFSNSDLRGFDFTGANLWGCYGINFQYDETTILTDAIVASSVFALEKEKRDYLSMHDDHFALYSRLKKEYWTTGALWAGENLRRKAKNFYASAKIAKYLYASVQDQTYKNQILYGISNTFKTREEYRDFLLNQITEPTITHRSLRGVIDILGSSFADDPTVKRLLLLYLGHANAEIRKICIRPVMSKRFFEANREAVLSCLMSETDPSLRMLFTQHFLVCVGRPISLVLLYRRYRKNFHDYAEPIDDRLFQELITDVVQRRKVLRKANQIQKGEVVSMGTDVRYDEFLDAIEFCEPEFRRLKELGLPLNLSYSIERFKKALEDDLDD